MVLVHGSPLSAGISQLKLLLRLGKPSLQGPQLCPFLLYLVLRRDLTRHSFLCQPFRAKQLLLHACECLTAILNLASCFPELLLKVLGMRPKRPTGTGVFGRPIGLGARLCSRGILELCLEVALGILQLERVLHSALNAHLCVVLLGHQHVERLPQRNLLCRDAMELG